VRGGRRPRVAGAVGAGPDAGATPGAAIAASAALPLILGLFRGVIATRTARESTPARRLPVRVDAAVSERRSDAGHRAA